MLRLRFAAFALVLCACRSQSSPAPSPSPSASSAGEDASCMTAAVSMERAKPHQSADPPYESCAAGVFGHCPEKGGGDRGTLCSLPLDIPHTERARKTKPDLCCY